jgi:hypothetical protein
MTISYAESGLSQAKYTALMGIASQRRTKPAFRLRAYQYSLDFGTTPFYDSANVDNLTTSDFDAVTIGDYLIRVSGTVLERLKISTGVWTLLTAPTPTGWLSDRPYALGVSGSTLSLYAVGTGGLYVATSTDNGTTFAAYTLLQAQVSGTTYSDNLLTGGTASSNSQKSDAPASNLFDALPNTPWVSADATGLATITYDLGAANAFAATKLNLKFEGSTYKTYILNGVSGFDFQGSNNNSTWTTLLTSSFGGGGWSGQTYTFANVTSYRYYRLNITSAKTYFHVASTNPMGLHRMQAFSTLGSSYPMMLMAADDAGNYSVISKNITTGNYIMGFGTLPSRVTSYDLAHDVAVCEFETSGPIEVTLDTSDSSQTVSRINTATGIYAITNNVLYPIDVIDIAETWRFRVHPKITKLGDTYFVTAYSSDGSASHPITGYRVYTSKDGQHWSKGELLSLPSSASGSGVILLRQGDFVYAVERKRVFRAYSTLMTGYAPNRTIEDLTPHIAPSGIDFSQSQMMQVGFTLLNPDGWLNNHAFLDGEHRVLLKLSCGYTLGTDTAPTLVDTALLEMDTLDISDALPANSVKITGRDLISWMTDRVKAENAVVWKEGFAAGDNFSSIVGTNYGGLGSVAIQKGDWKSRDGYLVASSNNAECLEFSTLASTLWNGEVRVTAEMLNANDKFGIIFRAVDKNNFWYARFTSTGAVLEIIERRNGTDTVQLAGVWSSSSTVTPVIVHAVVKFNYATITAGIELEEDYFIGTNANTLIHTVVSTDRVYGTPYRRTVSDSLLDQGFTGLYALVPGSIRFSNYTVVDYTEPATVEDVIKNYACYAGIHDFTLEPLYELDISLGWNTFAAGALADTYVTISDGARVTNPHGTFVANFPSTNAFDSSLSTEAKANLTSPAADFRIPYPTQALWYATGRIHYTTGTVVSSQGTSSLGAGVGSLNFSLVAATSFQEFIVSVPVDTFGHASDLIVTNRLSDAVGGATIADLYIEGTLPQLPARIINTNLRLPHSHKINLSCSSVFYPVIAQESNGNCYAIQKVQTAVPYYILFRFENGYGTPVGSVPVSVLSGDVTITFSEYTSVDAKNTVWHSIGFFNGSVVRKYVYMPTTPTAGDLYFGFTGSVLPTGLTALTMPHLTEFAETTTLDPGESAMSGLQRAIEGRYLKMFMRWDGSLRAWRPKERDIASTYSRAMITNFNETKDPRALRTHIRQVGADLWAEYYDADLAKKHGHTFEELNNPYLLSEAECYQQAKLSVLRLQEQAFQASFTSIYNPLLEPEDRLLVKGTGRIIGERSVSLSSANAIETISTRLYTSYGA